MILQEVIQFGKEKKTKGENIKFTKPQNEETTSTFEQSSFITEQKKAIVIEESDGKLKVKNVKITTKNSSFSYFLDGIERKRIVFNYNFIPVTYGYVAAVIMKRTDKKMHSIDMTEKSENIYLPYKENSDCPDFYFDFNEFTKFKFAPVNTGKKDKKTGNYPLFPVEFEQKAHNEIQETRREIEQNLAEKWLAKNYDDGWLFIDGRLSTKSQKLISNGKAVGVIKSHHVSYFTPEEQFKIYNLKKGERSSVFQPEKNENNKTEKENFYSWYLKIHESQYNSDNTFGLIRVEIPAKQELLNQVDEISNWILLETKPIAFPASRWDRMIYPIKYCEDYLKSNAPSWTMLESLY